MSLSAVALYSGTTIGSGASLTFPTTGTKISVATNSSLVGNAVAFNFILASGSNSPGSNASLNFKYAFSMSSYSSNIPETVGFGASIISIRAPSTPSITIDFTTQYVVPITGNYLYTWFDLNGPLFAPITVSVNAIPIAVTNYIVVK